MRSSKRMWTSEKRIEPWHPIVLGSQCVLITLIGNAKVALLALRTSKLQTLVQYELSNQT